jgi:hypothetical protein
MKTLFIGCAMAALLVSPAAAQGLGVGLGAGLDAPGHAVGSVAATARQGAADVLPRTSASPTGVEQGSRSSANAAASFGANAAATTDIRSGALIKNNAGATVGRITEVLDATANAPARVVIQQGQRSITVPRSELSVDGRLPGLWRSRLALRSAPPRRVVRPTDGAASRPIAAVPSACHQSSSFSAGGCKWHQVCVTPPSERFRCCWRPAPPPSLKPHNFA